MIISSASIGSEWFLNGTATLQREQTKTQREISSGYRIQDAADSPAQTEELIRLGSNLVTQQTYKTNLGRVQAETNAADAALGTGIKLIESARTIALQGSGTTVTASDRQPLAAQIQSIQQQLISLANTTTEGRYIFGGDQDLSSTYQLNPASPNGADKLTPQTATRVITDPSGQPIYQARTASTIFDHQNGAAGPAPDNALAALQSLQVALAANDSPGIATALTSLESVSGWLNQQQASYGVDGQRIAQEQLGATAEITSLQTQISAIRDTDIVQAATDLTRESTAQSAAFAAQAQIPRKSLFDYLG
ncbi:MAG: flagellar hook-associated protein 3 FlgL [Bryobacterales bacterium]|jgi:flagellar hook-associated protein 3 FlgL|nr:flagellar hook-associated protein 3 FlgL [Bryobacterales bacterium]